MLVVIEGLDGCGKQTQSEILYNRLNEEGISVKLVSYPRYDKASSAMVKAYLAGDFGSDPDAISPYIASTFYAADRYASYKEELESVLKDGGLVIADRYTTANMVHQAGKIKDKGERADFMRWLEDYEYRLLGLPKPDLVFFLNLPLEVSCRLMAERANKITGNADKDIHEKSQTHLLASREAALAIAEEKQWEMILCARNGEMRGVEEIHQDIYQKVMEVLHG